MKKLIPLGLTALLLALGGCQTISNGADYLGSYMPVIGERCEHWQCFTTEGKAISESKRMHREMEEGTLEAAPSEMTEEEAEATEETVQSSEPIAPVIPPSTESGIPEVEQRGARKPFPQPF